ncbi:hypothetical protein H6F76_16190 [Leptolyngbya sp. FACHB-321]|uniref:hypothetical protein n=1 Tax=Leptolyngbya sp. FACHB-321 TaxID=2692807 RepID=UPI00168669C2|nr:hypothetical protein [Leptolyngbya sp. FACHB-321]MBD2036553.1 hypothetical protein [Leptolyngbya sp. FACHB-321]
MSDNNSSSKQPWIIAIALVAIPAFASIAVEWVKKPHQPTQQASTSIPAPSATNSPSSSPKEIAKEWRQKARQILPPRSGKLDHAKGLVNVETLGLNERNIIIEATFYNPYDTDIGDWSYGFVFRRIQKSDVSDTFDLFVQSNNSSYVLHNSRQEGYRAAKEAGSVPNLDLSPHGSNKISAYIKDGEALLFVNDKYIKTLDVSSLTANGDVGVAANFNVEGIQGKSTRYLDLVVYSLNAVE